MRAMDKLSLIGLELWLRVGCTREERAFPQRILMDVTLSLPLRAAGKADRLESTVDYAALARDLKNRLEKKEFRLFEAVAEQAAEQALKLKNVKKVFIRVIKKALPGIDHATVEIERP